MSRDDAVNLSSLQTECELVKPNVRSRTSQMLIIQTLFSVSTEKNIITPFCYKIRKLSMMVKVGITCRFTLCLCRLHLFPYYIYPKK